MFSSLIRYKVKGNEAVILLMNGENVKFIFGRAVLHYVDVLRKLQSDKELEFSDDVFRVSIQDNIEKLEGILKGLESPDPEPSYILEQNRQLLCCSLQSYIDDLEKMKELIKSKLQTSEPSLPTINFQKVDDQIEMPKRIRTKSCFEKGLLNP